VAEGGACGVGEEDGFAFPGPAVSVTREFPKKDRAAFPGKGTPPVPGKGRAG
jgi:hypothetical protein